jgi:hypothetical protein
MMMVNTQKKNPYFSLCIHHHHFSYPCHSSLPNFSAPTRKSVHPLKFNQTQVCRLRDHFVSSTVFRFALSGVVTTRPTEHSTTTSYESHTFFHEFAV